MNHRDGVVNIDALLNNWELNRGASEGELLAITRNLPQDYVEFLRKHNGGEGFIGDDYFILWKAQELDRFNLEYEVEEYAPGIFLFGSSGGGEGYGFDTREKGLRIVRLPFIGMDLRYVKGVADSFTALLNNQT
jgi:hypothetical protein